MSDSLDHPALSATRNTDDGEGVPEDATEAVRWYRLAADQGYAEAQNNLGLMYLDGDGADQDTFEAVRLFESVAALGPNEVGFGYAATSLGWIYLTGKSPGISRNTEEALRWNLFGAGSGHTNALSNLAMMYAEGIGADVVSLARELLDTEDRRDGEQAKLLRSGSP
jgi:TPR repeat protein